MLYTFGILYCLANKGGKGMYMFCIDNLFPKYFGSVLVEFTDEEPMYMEGQPVYSFSTYILITEFVKTWKQTTPGYCLW